MSITSIRQNIVAMNVVNDVTFTRQSVIPVWSYDFDDMALYTE